MTLREGWKFYNGQDDEQKGHIGHLNDPLPRRDGHAGTFSPIKFARADEIGPNEVQGKVIDIYTNVFPKGTIAVKSNQTGKTYTFYVGRRPIYVPHRYPSRGEAVKVLNINDRGVPEGYPSGDSPVFLNLS